MQYIYSDLGQQPAGAGVHVTLTSAANVFLVDAINYSHYQAGRAYHYYGGLAHETPVRLTVPRAGHWYAVVDLRGLRGDVRASIRVLPGPLPAI